MRAAWGRGGKGTFNGRDPPAEQKKEEAKRGWGTSCNDASQLAKATENWISGRRNELRKGPVFRPA